MRAFLDTLYRLSGGIAAALILGICLLISAQIVLNVTARIMGPGWSFTIPSYADFSGYMLAGASFLALAQTLRMGGHIRVSLVTSRLPGRTAFAAEILCLILALGLAGLAGWFLISLVGESLRYGDTSSGIVAIPLWIPQTTVTVGMGLLCLALLDTLVETIRAGRGVLPDGGEA